MSVTIEQNGPYLRLTLIHSAYPFVGLGAPNPNDPHEIIPIVTWDAIPGNVYILKPSSKWITAKGLADQGTLTDLNSYGIKDEIVLTTEHMSIILEYENGKFERHRSLDG